MNAFKNDLLYRSTRGSGKTVTASQAVLKGIADDGGLYVPDKIPVLDKPLSELMTLPYRELAYEILKLFLADYTEEELRNAINLAYDDKFDDNDIAPLKHAGGYHFLELFHGKTLAFKDMALSILPHLMTTAARKNGLDKKIVILTATSGDTGKAALEGFAGIDGTDIIVFYPENGVSKIQERQMTTQDGDNTCVIGVYGNFDDAQTGVKKIFNDGEFNASLSDKGVVLSSANSINIGRLVPQVVYYFYAYAQMVRHDRIKLGEKVNFTVPTGNFGNILAGYYAKSLGLPVNKLICASNSNKVLYDFFKTGDYDKNRKFELTMSPSMDILISSNLERFIYHKLNDADKTAGLMNQLNTTGSYSTEISDDDIVGEFTGEDETLEGIREVFSHKYLIDTHTAVAYMAYKKYKERTGDATENVIISTASPYKFCESVYKALTGTYDADAFETAKALSSLTGVEIPDRIKDIQNKEIRHKAKCSPGDMKEMVSGYISKL